MIPAMQDNSRSRSHTTSQPYDTHAENTFWLSYPIPHIQTNAPAPRPPAPVDNGGCNLPNITGLNTAACTRITRTSGTCLISVCPWPSDGTAFGT